MPSEDSLTRAEKQKLTWLRGQLLVWAGPNGRSFPWRDRSASLYEQVVVEVLLQRTTASAVARFYEAFFARFPSWDRLAAAAPSDLESFLKPLGLWRRRAASLLGLAGYAASSGGRFPLDARERLRVPAVGQYVSNAIAVFQHGKPSPLLDVNMARVIERFVRPRRLADIRYDPWLQAAAHWLVRANQPAAVNWAVLDFAALICRARNPLCSQCPVRPRCSHWLSNRAMDV